MATGKLTDKEKRWWNSLSADERQQYLKKYPDSKFGEKHINSEPIGEKKKKDLPVNERTTTKKMNTPKKPVNETKARAIMNVKERIIARLDFTEVAMTPDQFIADAEKAAQYVNKELKKLFPKAHKIDCRLGNILKKKSSFHLDFVYDDAPVTFHNAKAYAIFLMHLTDGRGEFVNMDKFSFELVTGTLGGKFSPIKFRKITAKSPMDASKKLVEWFKKNKDAIIKIGEGEKSSVSKRKSEKASEPSLPRNIAELKRVKPGTILKVTKQDKKGFWYGRVETGEELEVFKVDRYALFLRGESGIQVINFPKKMEITFTDKGFVIKPRGLAVKWTATEFEFVKLVN